MAAALQSIDLIVGHALRQACKLFVLPKKCIPIKATIFCGKGLHLTINRVGKGARQSAC